MRKKLLFVRQWRQWNRLVAKFNKVHQRLAVAMDVVKRMAEFVAKKKPALAHEFVELMEPFGDEIARVYG